MWCTWLWGLVGRVYVGVWFRGVWDVRDVALFVEFATVVVLYVALVWLGGVAWHV